MKQSFVALLTIYQALLLSVTTFGFTQKNPKNGRVLSALSQRQQPYQSSTTLKVSVNPLGGNPRKENSGSNSSKKKVKGITLGDLSKELMKNPAQLQSTTKKSKYHRTRKRVEKPKQQYLYKNQREYLKKIGELPPKKKKRVDDDQATEDEDDDDDENTVDPSRDPLLQAKEFGLNPAFQHCDPLIDAIEPVIVGQIRVGNEEGSSSYAYLIEKPAGWSIVGGGSAKQPVLQQQVTKASRQADQSSRPPAKSKKNQIKRLKIEEEDGSVDILEYDEAAVMALLTPEELEEYLKDKETLEADELNAAAKITLPSKMEGIDDQEIEIDEEVMRPESSRLSGQAVTELITSKEDLDPTTAANLLRIATRNEQMKSKSASFASKSRPSVVAWLKDLKAEQGTPIRGGNYWTAVAGATEVDDSGLVLLCPKANVDNAFVEYAEYTAVSGTSGFLAPKSKVKQVKLRNEDSVTVEVVSRLMKGRAEDVVQTVRVVIPDGPSTCSNVVDICQGKLEQGIRGDPAANPFDRRARRRLIHCNSLSASSLLYDETVKADAARIPSDISILTEQRTNVLYQAGTFSGRSDLKENPLTTAYREINGAADGFPGWTVDRYDRWLFVQHDPKLPKGPLPSIHDGNTAGVYYMPSTQDRSAIGSENGMRPRLYEGQPCPDSIVVVENGVKYSVSLDKDLSTGIFLDQRPQRAWLIQNCCSDTHVLNCFAHTGAFSVAAAVAGASTVSLDLSQKWLERLPEHFRLNNIAFDERHDRIYGDCFDWLTRLAKRGEKYDVVILDPPSSSVGGRKKQRWSVKNDMDELVALAAPLVKSGGLLWTTTNSAALNPIKFARLCSKGLQDAGIFSAKLERIQPMPFDFPSIGSQPVKNLVWRIP